MRCINCKIGMKRVSDSVVFPSKVLGDVSVPNIKMDSCTVCEYKLLLPGESDKVIDYVLKRESERTGMLPASGFVTEKEVAEILGETKQGVNKNKKIRSGFILFTYLSGRRLYLKKSVEMFKVRGDGRIFLGQSLASSKPADEPIEYNFFVAVRSGGSDVNEIRTAQTASDTLQTFSMD